MAGRGPAPKAERRRRNEPTKDAYERTEVEGWQHGEIPSPPDGMKAESVEAWSVWMSAWFAAFWTPADLPGLRRVVRLYDEVERGEFQRSGELRLLMDTYGITPKGQQDRRWARPAAPVAGPSNVPASGTYGHLRSVPSAVEGKRES